MAKNETSKSKAELYREERKARIAKAEADLNAKMDKYYQKFAAMESAMAQLQNQQNNFTSMLG